MRGIADIRINFYQKITPDDHRFGFRMVDVDGNDGATPSHLVTHELRCDMLRQECTKIMPWMLAHEEFPVLRLEMFAMLVFPYGYILHFRCDDATTGVVHLCHVRPRPATTGLTFKIEAHFREFWIDQTLPAISRTRTRENFCVSSLVYPFLA